MGILDMFMSREKAPSNAVSPLRKEHQERQKLFAEYWNYYRGRHHKQLKPPTTGADDNVTVNLAKKVVNSSVHFLFGEDVAFEIDEEDERNEQELYLDDVWQDRPLEGFSKMAFLQDVGINGAVFGSPFVRLYPPAANGQRHRMVNVDPMLVDVVTSPDDMSRVEAYYIVWKVDKQWKRDRITRADGGGWEIVRQIWRPAEEWVNVDEPARWEFEFAPLFHCKNLPNPRGFWGVSDLEDADMNDAINFVRSNTNRIIRHHAHPKTVGVGMSPSQVQATAIDGFWTTPSGSSVSNLEMQSDLASSREFAADLVQHFHEITDTPNLDPANVQVGALSGFALRILYGPLLSKTESKRRRYGGMLSRLNTAILVTGGRAPADTVVNVKWQDALPVAGKERAEELQILTSAGANIRGAAEVVGYTREEAELLAAVETFPQEFER